MYRLAERSPQFRASFPIPRPQAGDCHTGPSANAPCNRCRNWYRTFVLYGTVLDAYSSGTRPVALGYRLRSTFEVTTKIGATGHVKVSVTNCCSILIRSVRGCFLGLHLFGNLQFRRARYELYVMCLSLVQTAAAFRDKILRPHRVSALIGRGIICNPEPFTTNYDPLRSQT